MNTATRRVGSQLRHSTSNNHLGDFKGRTKPVLPAAYIVGLTDGEGCFYVNVWKSSAYRAGAGVQLQFHIKLNERDRGLLESVRDSLNCGSVYYQKETRANHTQCFRYTVNSHRDIVGEIIPFFQQNPLQSASKRLSFNIFCQIADLVKQGKHLTEEGLERIRALKEKMNHKTGLA